MSHPCNTQPHQLPQVGPHQLLASFVPFHSDAVGTGCVGQLPCVAMCAHTPSNKHVLKTVFHHLMKLRRLPSTGRLLPMLQKIKPPLFTTLKTEAACSSKVSVIMYHTTRCNNPLTSNCHSHWHENLKFHTFKRNSTAMCKNSFSGQDKNLENF